MEGEDEDTGDPRAFSRQKGWKKIIILCAGSFMHFLLGLVIMVALALGVSQVSAPIISGFMDGFALEGESGLMVGDRLLEIDGHAIWQRSDAFLYLDRNDGVSGVDLVVERDGQRIVLDDFPMTRAIETEENGRVVKKFGITIGQMEELSLPGRLRYGFLQTVDFVRIVWVSLGDLVTGRVAVSQLSGVIGVVDVVSEMGEQAQDQAQSALAGVLDVLSMMALIAVNLAVMNMLPGGAQHDGPLCREPGGDEYAPHPRAGRRADLLRAAERAPLCRGEAAHPGEIRGLCPRRGLCGAAGPDGGGGPP